MLDERDYENENLKVADPHRVFLVNTHHVNSVKHDFGGKEVQYGRVAVQ